MSVTSFRQRIPAAISSLSNSVPHLDGVLGFIVLTHKTRYEWQQVSAAQERQNKSAKENNTYDEHAYTWHIYRHYKTRVWSGRDGRASWAEDVSSAGTCASEREEARGSSSE